MITPTIHPNGTSAEVLKEQWKDAYKAISQAITVLQIASPNGRDYYAQGPEALTQAIIEHDARLTALYSVRDDMFSFSQAVDRQHRLK